MTAPTRIVYGPRNVYRLDPYVRDAGGRFAVKPATTPPPVELIELQASTVEYLANGAVVRCEDVDSRNHWTVRVVREDDGSHRVVYLPD